MEINVVCRDYSNTSVPLPGTGPRLSAASTVRLQCVRFYTFSFLFLNDVLYILILLASLHQLDQIWCIIGLHNWWLRLCFSNCHC